MAEDLRKITEEEAGVWKLLASIPDPEIPVISICDLGIVRQVKLLVPRTHVEILVTPTYSGCPAIDMIAADIRAALLKEGYAVVHVAKTLTPAWTTDWLSSSAKQKLKEYGIAPPGNRHGSVAPFKGLPAVQCPLCESDDTQVVSEFGSTPCKALYRCNQCHEPFDVFKCH